jgi:putative ABC transport system permease protein
MHTALMILGVALGVTVVIAIDLANESARRAFMLSSQAVTGRATHQIVGSSSGIAEDLYQQLRVQQGFGNIAPVVEGLGVAIDLDQQPLRILGVDPFAETPFRSFVRSEVTTLAGFEQFFLEPKMVLVFSQLRDRYDLQPGDEIRLQVNDRITELSILGVLGSGDEGQATEDLLIMDIAAAQELLGFVGRLSRIDVLAGGEELEQIIAALPQGVTIQPATDQTTTIAQFSEAFSLNLEALSLLALVVGMFLIYNTMMFSVLQRRQTFGILRMLGAQEEQILRMVLFEAVLVSGLGALIGVPLGWLLGQGAVGLVSQTITDLYFVVSVRQATLLPGSVLKGIGLGILIGVAAALVPAIEATRVPPIVAQRRSTVEEKSQRWSMLLFLLGAFSTILGVIALVISSDSLPIAFGGMFLTLLGIAGMVPILTQTLLTVSRPIYNRVFGSIGRMANGLISGSLSRTSVAIAALMVSLAVAIGVGIMISSFRTTVENWLGLTLRADLYISAPTVSGTRPAAALPREFSERLQQIPGVGSIETVRTVRVQSEVGEVLLLAVNAERAREAALYRFAQGSPREIWDQVLAGAVMVSEPFAFRNDIPPSGGSLELVTDQGTQHFPIVAVYYDYSTDRGAVLMSSQTYQQYWDDPSISSLALFLEPGVDPEVVTKIIRNELRGTGLQIQPNRSLRNLALAIFDRTFLITYALRILAVMVAFIGVVATLMALQMERARELATIQVLGMEDRDLWKLTLLETGTMGAIAGLIAIPVGAILALVLVYVINLRSFGWTIQIQLDPWIFLGALVTAILAALLASVYPTLRIRRQPLVENLREE